MRTLAFLNGQRTRPLNIRYLRSITTALLDHVGPIADYDLAIHLVSAPEMTRLNQTFLRHEGPTDVITFDYSEDGAKQPPCPALHGEIFICVAEAVAQAETFRTSWQSEIVRYLVHGILHLQGFDDVRPKDRRAMKREESRLMRWLSRRFDLRR